MTTQEITVRIAKTIPDLPSGADQYTKPEPLTAEVIITETCPKKKYGERVDELLDLASEKVFGYLGIDSDQDDHPEEIPADESEFIEGEEGGEGRGDEDEEGQGEEGFEETGFEEGGEFEEGGRESGGEGGEFEEGSGDEGEEGGGGDDEFSDFFDEDDPGGEVD